MPIIPPISEAEIIVFGSGFGECILVHNSNNEWIVIDSFINRNTGRPIAVDYLLEKGIDPKQAVKLIVCSHWHDDHIKGLDILFKDCQRADFVLSGALRSNELLIIKECYDAPSKYHYGLNTFSSIIEHYIDNAKNHRTSKEMRYAIADRKIYSSTSSACSIFSLSPSDRAKTLANSDIAQLISRLSSDEHNKKPNKAIMANQINPNYVSVVLWIKIGCHELLLGSDLQMMAESELGWTAIISSRNKPDGKAAIFKIPHHGSANAHSDNVWEQMLIENPIAICTPFKHGRVSLPTNGDKERIKTYSKRSYITSHKLDAVLFDKAVLRTMQEASIKLRSRSFKHGFVRVCFNPNIENNYLVDIQSGARSL